MEALYWFIQSGAIQGFSELQEQNAVKIHANLRCMSIICISKERAFNPLSNHIVMKYFKNLSINKTIHESLA
jgi:hypothetical protein